MSHNNFFLRVLILFCTCLIISQFWMATEHWKIALLWTGLALASIIVVPLLFYAPKPYVKDNND